MLKKIGTFLMIMLAICAVLLLTATANRSPDPTETTQPTVETTAPETAPPETTPETGAAPTEIQPADAVREQVAQILDREKLVTTKTTRLVSSPGLGADTETSGLAATSHGRALAEELAQRQVNPIAAHWELVYEGLYLKHQDESGKLSVTALQAPGQTATSYEYTDAGARQLLTDLLVLAAQMDDGLELEMALLGANLSVEADQVFHSEEEQCRYAYFACNSDRATYILCFYLRGGAQIEDVEFQLLTLRHASGTAEALAKGDMDTVFKNQKAHADAREKALRTELLMQTPEPAGGGESPTMTKEKLRAMSPQERYEFSVKNPEEYKNIYGGN
jgi:hypothetical protein